MAVTTSVARSYTLRMLITAVVSALLGAWGIYDYAISIPNQEESFQRYAVLEAVKDVLETQPDDATYQDKRKRALTLVLAELDEYVQREAADLGIGFRSVSEDTPWFQMLLVQVYPQEDLPEALVTDLGYEEAGQIVEAIEARGESAKGWFAGLFQLALGIQQRRRPGDSLVGPALAAYEAAERETSLIGSPKKPGKYDRIIKGLIFIPCLPLAPVFLWMWLKTKRRVYTLEDDGTLHLPEGTWPADEIADIDMSKWMAKSIAHVVHAEGERVKLDAYLYARLDLIIGMLAHRFYPDEWTEDARPADSDEEDEILEEDEGDEAEDAHDDGETEDDPDRP